MYRCNSVKEYRDKLDFIINNIEELKSRHSSAQSIVDLEHLKLSYLIELEYFKRERSSGS